MSNKSIVLALLVAALFLFGVVAAASADEAASTPQVKNAKGDKQAKEEKYKYNYEKPKQDQGFFKAQNRRGFAIGPRVGAYFPMDSDFNENIPMMAQSGLDMKAYIRLHPNPYVPWIGIALGMGVAGGGSEGEIDFHYVPTEGGEANAKDKELTAYWATTMIPVNLGLTVEILPYHVFDPYLGGGVGFYLMTHLIPREDLPEDYNFSVAPSDFASEFAVGAYGVFGVDIKFHDYLGLKLEGSYHMIPDSDDLEDVNVSGLMISLGTFMFF